MKRTAGPWPLSRYESSCPFNIAVRSRMPTITAPIRCLGVPPQDSVTPRPGTGITASARPLVTLAAASDLPLSGSGAQHAAAARRSRRAPDDEAHSAQAAESPHGRSGHLALAVGELPPLAKLSLPEIDDDHRRVLAVVTFLEAR